MASNYDRQVFRQLEDVLKKCDNLSLEIVNIKKEHAKEIDNLNQRIDTLEQENNSLKMENKILKNDNDRMKSILNKDSSNSSIPPSKDERTKKNKVNLREKSTKKSGGQKNHKGATFTKKDVEKILENENVKKETIEHGNKNSKHCLVKYEIDTETIVIVREHKFYYDNRKDLKLPKEFKSDVHYGENFKSLTNIMVVEEVISLERIEQFIEILTQGLLKVSQGSIVNWLHEKSKKCLPILKNMKKSLRNYEVMYTDLTETNVNNKKSFVRNYSTTNMTVYIPSKDKKIHRVKRQWILNGYTGYIVHDHDTSLYNFGLKDRHVECNVHLRRYLKNNIELTKHQWSEKMDKLFLEIKSEKEKLLALGINEFSDDILEEYNLRYDEILKEGYEECKKSNSKYLKQEEKALLNRLSKYKYNHLLFAYDFKVPFDNNLSERDLRAIKTKKKVSGCHRSYTGLKDYCNIRSIISTCKKQGIDYFKELVNIGKGNLTTFAM